MAAGAGGATDPKVDELLSKAMGRYSAATELVAELTRLVDHCKATLD